MSYTALYRKFRPLVFEDVKGQEHIVGTLRNQIMHQRIGHAYLFCGTRGTGKTTIAKIFARAVNCESPVNGGPCGACPTCQSILAGQNLNVAEIDAASNNSVENVREIIEAVSYPPVDTRYKVFIIDEVHMLSAGAFNALLKTLEEPPSYVVFILATTEVHKIPITILSRCQRYDFKRISLDTIADRMRELTDKENMQIEDKALRYIAKVADGSMRDALSLLDQCNAFHYGETLTYDMALEVLGAVDAGVFSRLLRNVIANDIFGCLSIVEEVVMQGRELGQFVKDFVWYLRNLMLLKSSTEEKVEEVLDVSTEHLKLLREEADMLDLNSIIRYINVFSELSGQLRYASQKRVIVEMAVIKLCTPEMEIDTTAILERVRKLEKKLEQGIVVQSAPGAPVTAQVAATKPIELPAALPEEIEQVRNEWPVILGKTEHLTRGLLSEAKLSIDPDTGVLLLCFKNEFIYNQVNTDEKIEEIHALLAEHTGREVPFELRTYNDQQEFSEQYYDLLQGIHMDIEEV